MKTNNTLMITCLLLIAWIIGANPSRTAAQILPDMLSVAPDLMVPETIAGPPAPGRRVRQRLPRYEGTQVYHLLYLPTDWRPGGRYPVIVEYAGNGPYKNEYGDVSTGHPEGSKLGYGISGGRGFIWICMPYVNAVEKKNQTLWWGDVPATLDYCIETVKRVCEDYGGDPNAVLLTGFSRGAIGCNYLGLHNDRIADLWLGFIPYSHYDGLQWDGAGGGDKMAARTRLARLKGRASFICHEGSTSATRAWLAASGQRHPFTFIDVPFRNHNDGWVLRETPQRRQLRAWVADVLVRRPGTHAVRGRVTAAHGEGLAGVRVSSGETHWTLTGREGRYELPGLIDGGRTVRISGAKRKIEIAGRDIENVDFKTGADAISGTN